MKHIYRKSQKLEYNGHEFRLLVRDDNKNAFLKIIYDEKGEEKYTYPTAQEFLHLSSIMNPNTRIKFAKKYTFKEKVFIGGSLLTLSAGVVAMLIANKDSLNNPDFIRDLLNKNNKENAYTIESEGTNDYIEYIGDHFEAFNMTGLSKYIPSITTDEVFATLNDNKHITSIDKEFITDYINKLINKVPDVDLRVLNENLKDLKILRTDNEETRSSFNSETRVITLTNEDDLAEELVHATRTLYKTINDKNISYNFVAQNVGTSLEEGITENLLNEMYGINRNRYKKQSGYANILINTTDYTYTDYFNSDASTLINKVNDGTNTIITILNDMDTELYSSTSDLKFDIVEFDPIRMYLIKYYYQEHNISSTFNDRFNALSDYLYEANMFEQSRDELISTFDVFANINENQNEDVVVNNIFKVNAGQNETTTITVLDNENILGTYDINQLYIAEVDNDYCIIDSNNTDIKRKRIIEPINTYNIADIFTSNYNHPEVVGGFNLEAQYNSLLGKEFFDLKKLSNIDLSK